MNKTLIINIAGSIFHIEEDAYNAIMDYYKQISNRFNNSPDGFEIIADIENRIAELLDEKLKHANRKVIVKQDVAEVVDRLGKVADFDADASEETKQNEPSAESNAKHRKLFRDPDNKNIGGVCAGLAAFFGCDPLWTRLLFVALCCPFFGFNPPLFIFGITMIILYIILMIIIPEAKTVADKMAMKGEPDNLDGIINKIREMGTKAEQTMQNTELQGFFNTLFAALGKTLNFVMQFAIKTCGLTLAIAAILLIIALPIAVAIYLTDNAIFYSNEGSLNLYNFIDRKYQTTFVITLLTVIIVPAFRLAWFGLKTTTNIKPLNKNLAHALWGIWIIALIGTAYITVETSLDFKEKVGMEESSPMQLSASATLLLNGSPQNTIYDDEITIDGKIIKKKFYIRTNNRQNRARLSIEKSPDNNARIIKRTSACGRNPKEAIKNIENINYAFTQRDSTLSIDRIFHLADNALWRNQQCAIILQIPVGSLIKANETACNMSYQLNYWNCRENNNAEYAIWQMTENGLKCTLKTQEKDNR